jgi:hypothetical protein
MMERMCIFWRNVSILYECFKFSRRSGCTLSAEYSGLNPTLSNGVHRESLFSGITMPCRGARELCCSMEKKRVLARCYVDSGGRACSSTGNVRVWLFLTIVTFIVWPGRVYSSR